jgi:uncharacterized membrane protein HdeD (DUF308 family)
MGVALEGDSRRALRPNGAFLARDDAARAPRRLRGLRPRGRRAGHRRRDKGSWGRRWLLLAEGALSLLAGLVVLFWAGTTALVLVYVFSAWAIFTGLLKVVMAISFRREIENGWLMGLGGALSVLFGVILGFLPGAGLVTLVWLVGIYALILGVALVMLGFLDRGQRHANGSRVT